MVQVDLPAVRAWDPGEQLALRLSVDCHPCPGPYPGLRFESWLASRLASANPSEIGVQHDAVTCFPRFEAGECLVDLAHWVVLSLGRDVVA
jgi:hypothetical protein